MKSEYLISFRVPNLIGRCLIIYTWKKSLNVFLFRSEILYTLEKEDEYEYNDASGDDTDYYYGDAGYYYSK